MRIESVFGILSAIKLASAACGGAWSQCGGNNYQGETCCVSGYACKKVNDWYSYCEKSASAASEPVPVSGAVASEQSEQPVKKAAFADNAWGNWGNNNAANPWAGWGNTGNNNNNAANPWGGNWANPGNNNNNNNANPWANWGNNNNNNNANPWGNWANPGNTNNNNNNGGWDSWFNTGNTFGNTQPAPAQDTAPVQNNPAPTQEPVQAPTQQETPAAAPAQQNNNSNANANVKWPKAEKNVKLNAPIVVKAGQTYDGLKENGVWTSYGRGVNSGDCKNVEGGSSDAVFHLETGATLKNVILGKDSIEHVHCIGDGCTVENVWWDDVCEDALSLKGSTNQNAKFYLRGGGAKDGSDKIVQHNSAGTVYISNFDVKNSGKLYRSCGNCKSGYQNTRHVVIENVTASGVGVLAGINSNYGDTATFKNVNANGGTVCNTFTGNNNGKEPSKTGEQCKGKSDCTCK